MHLLRGITDRQINLTEQTDELQMTAAAAESGALVTPASLTRDLHSLGIRAGMLLNVHSAMSRLGFVAGGAQTVVDSLLDALGPRGTLMMPSHSGQLSEPGNWQSPPAPEAWWQTIRDEMPAFDRQRTPTRLMGAIPELFRTYPGAVRSPHPQTSHTALGPLAAEIVAEHPLECLFGDSSPMGKLYALDGWVLLLGVGHGNNTVLHLAEDRATFPSKSHQQEGSPIQTGEGRVWQTFNPLKISAADFPAIGEAFARGGSELTGLVGGASARLMRARDVVDFSTEWISRNRS